MNTPLKSLVALCAMALSLAARAADEAKFESIVPEDAWLVLSAENIAATRERWSATPLGQWWQSESVQAIVKEEIEASRKRMTARRQELGVEEDAWSWPASFGIGLYVVHDEDLDADLPHFILCGTWKDNPDKVATIFDALFVEMQKKDAGAVTSLDIRGKPARAIRIAEEHPTPKKKAKSRKRGEGNAFVPDGAFDHIETIYYVRDGERFLFGSVKQDLDEALGVYEGTSRKSVAESADFKKTLDSVGRNDGWMVLLTSSLHKVAGAGGPQMALVQPFLQTLFGDVHGYGFSLSSEAPGAQFELLSSIVIEGERMGLLALPNPARVAAPPPAFVAGGASGYGTVNVQFPLIMKLVESVVASLPEEMAEPFDATLQQYGPDLTRAFARLGPDVHIIRRDAPELNPAKDSSRRSGADKEESLYAIRCADEQAVTTLLNLFLPEAGFESRDFNGNTIFDEKSREACCGFGGGWFFMGNSSFVEQCLRTSGKDGTGTLAETPVCRQALADVGTKPVLCWGYQDILIRLDSNRRESAKSTGKVSVGVTSAPDDFEHRMATRAGLDIPNDLIIKLLQCDAKLWKEAMGPGVYSVTEESSLLLTRVRLLPPTAP
ncbi:MAG: hypothetical protein K8R92_09965 [Planctomycetes bacterium]|nr:hypothetical protein [Planctomycetota bacterium]